MKGADAKAEDGKPANEKAEQGKADKGNADKAKAGKAKAMKEEAKQAAAASSSRLNAIWVLGFGALGLLAFLIYTALMQRVFYKLAGQRIQRGGSLEVESIPLSATRAQTAEAVTTPIVVVTGPVSTIVGQQSSVYTVKVNAQDHAGEVTWSIAPPEAAVVMPSKTATARVVPAKAGAFKLTATVGGGTGALDIAALESSTSNFKLPFIGAGVGSFYVAIMILILAAVLGILGILSGEAVATLIGALAGYIFGFNRGQGEPNSEEKEKKNEPGA